MTLSYPSYSSGASGSLTLIELEVCNPRRFQVFLHWFACLESSGCCLNYRIVHLAVPGLVRLICVARIEPLYIIRRNNMLFFTKYHVHIKSICPRSEVTQYFLRDLRSINDAK